DNRLTSDGTFTYEYDAEGNRVRRSETATGDVTEYTWDHRNRLTAVVTRNSGGVVLQHVEYTYDPFNNRIAKQVDVDGDGPAESEGEHYVYNGSRIALVFDNTGNLQHRYLHGPAIDQILADEDAMGNVLWPLTDQVGSVRDLVDSTGTVVNHLVYDSFGQLTSETNAAVDHLFGFTGREYDEETGMNYYRARYYDPTVGRFLSTDPSGFHGGDSNLYRYVGNNPITFTDPMGLQQQPVTISNPVGVPDTFAISDPGTGDVSATGTVQAQIVTGRGGEGNSATAQTGKGPGGDPTGERPSPPANTNDPSNTQNHQPSQHRNQQRSQEQKDKKDEKEKDNAKCKSGSPSPKPSPAPSPTPTPKPTPTPDPGSNVGGGGGRGGDIIGQMLQGANDLLDPADKLLQATEGVTKAFAKGFEKKVFDLANTAKALTGSVAGTAVLLVSDDTELALKIMKESGASDLSLAIGAAINDPGKALQKMYQSVENDIKAADQAAKSGDYRRSGEAIG
ncbi:MAG: RHS repeat-associated core domain-containing protein, partial [Planctomycetales bacterium]|nr:RHS repeat-associated core domain-containing protein [Planctomycetales bacterium]